MTHPNRPLASAQPPAVAYDTALLDLDGVVYAGGEPIRTRSSRWRRRAGTACGWRT